MITIIPLCLLVWRYAHKLKVSKEPAFWFNIAAALLITISSYVEGWILSPGDLFPRLDEGFFLAEAQQPLGQILQGNQRYLGYVLFSYVTYSSAGAWAIKIQSVPFALLTALTLYDATRCRLTLWLFPVFFGYFYFLSTLDMRDSIIIWAVLFFSLRTSRSRVPGVVLWSLIAITFFSVMRPEFSIIWGFMLIWLLLDRWLRRGSFTTYVLPALVLIVLFVALETPILAISDYFYPGRAARYLQDRSEELRKLPILNENASALVRQVITPLPTSKLRQLLSVGPSNNLVLKEVFRIILMSTVYAMGILLLLALTKTYRCLRRNKFHLTLLAFSVVNAVVYAIYGDGGGATRNKVYPFILLYVLFTSLVVLRPHASHIVTQRLPARSVMQVSDVSLGSQ